MIRYILALSVSLLTINVSGQTVNDGPYIFIEGKELIEKTIVDGNVIIKSLPLNAYPTEYLPEVSEYKNVEKIAALSDIHGQYDLFVELLKNNKIIDEQLQWNFGSGHLIIVGDIFDRGAKVTETLWLVYNLEEQAKRQGGKVHFLLGNHEYMVLFGDLRYIHKKYATVSELLDTNYKELFGKNTVLGRWLRSKATIVKINEDTYVHGGISKEFLSVGYHIDNINNLMRKSIDIENIRDTAYYKDYFGKNGPIWYRGYFYGSLQLQDVIDVLKDIDSEHMILGHCSNQHVVQLFDHRIFGVDSSIKKGTYGEVLLIDKKSYKRGTLKGDKISFE